MKSFCLDCNPRISYTTMVAAAVNQGIQNHDIDLVIQGYFGFYTLQFSYPADHC